MLFKNLDSLIAAVIGMTGVLLLTQHGGVGISPDSIYYISASHSLMAGNGFMQFDDSPFVLFPLIYPSFLALIEYIFRTDIVVLAPYINACLFGVTIFLSSSMLEKMKLLKWVKWIILLLIALSAGLLEIYTMLWSETLFITEIIIFIWCCFYYFKNSTLKNLWGVACIAALAADTRLAGVTVIITGGLLIVLSRELKGIKKWNHFFIYSLVSSSLLTINLVRNFLVATSFTGARQKGDTPILMNVKYFGEVIGDWFSLSKISNLSPLFFGLIFIFLLSAISIYRYSKKIEHNSFEKISACFTWVYLMFMLLSATFSKYEAINNRLLAPFFIPVLFTVGFYSISFIEWVKKPKLKYLISTLIALAGFFIIYNYYNGVVTTHQQNKEGGIGGYGEDDWLYSDLLLSVQKDSSCFIQGIPVYANASHAVYFYTKRHLSILPETKHVKQLQEFYELPQNILIWLTNEDNPAIETLDAIKIHKNLTVIKQYKDGFIFLCTPK